MEISVFRGDMRIVSKQDARDFYKCVKSVILIPTGGKYKIRVEPGNLIGFVHIDDLRGGRAWITPNLQDDNGDIAWHNRKHINAWLRGGR